MSRTEEAWDTLNKRWCIDTTTDDIELIAVRESMKRLRNTRMPVCSVDELANLIYKLDVYWTRTDNDARAFLKANHSWVYRQLSDDVEKMRAVDQDWIEVALDVLGIEFNWSHSSQPFEEFVEEMEVSEEVRAKFRERVARKREGQDYLRAAYQLMKEVKL